MKALTITQPWSHLVMLGAKKIETRSWWASHRGEVAIHASKTYPRWARDYEDEEPFRTALHPNGQYTYPSLSCGKIIAVAQLVDCVRINLKLDERFANLLTETERAFGDYTPGRYGLILANVRPVTPIEFKGALGFWTVPDSVAAAIREELAA